MRQFFSRPHPWLMQAVGGLIAVIAIIPIAAYVFIDVINAKTTAEPAAFAPPPSAQSGTAPASPVASSGGGSQAPGASGAAIAHPTWADVHTIFAKNCQGCHIGAALGGLNLDTYQAAMKGGSTSAGGPVNGPVIKPGKAAGSYLYQVVAGKQTPRMPLNRAPLPQRDIQTIYNWIQQGAKK